MCNTIYKYYIILIIAILCGCEEKRQQQFTPWGEPISTSVETSSQQFTVSDIQDNGEMIMITMYGPDTYFDYHGKPLGTQFMLCEKFAQKLGVSLRVEVCKSTDEMIAKLKAGEGDIIAYPIKKKAKETIPCGYAIDSTGTAWAVDRKNTELADSINRWYKPGLLTEVVKEEKRLFSTKSVHRHVYAPMLNASSGTISKYDHIFMKYAPLARWDWRLLAAQCYQESCFDPMAYSWAGAKGLMQIMPSTAAHLGLPQSQINDPEQNIYAAVRYICELGNHFKDVRDPFERSFFVLASYNGGYFHIRDAMNLAEKFGKNKYKWDNVEPYVLGLQSAEYYNDPKVKYGYMRGSETVNYVNKIHDRWRQYRGKARGGSLPGLIGTTPIADTPQKATKRHRFKL